MQCEICHKSKATKVLKGEGEDDEKYVCDACYDGALGDRHLPDESDGEGDDINALGEAIKDGLSQVFKGLDEFFQDGESERERNMKVFPVSHIDPKYRFNGRFHLEGLHILGQLEEAKYNVRQMGMAIQGIRTDQYQDVGHAFILKYDGQIEDARETVQQLLDHERDARNLIKDECPIVFQDAISRALAILQSARLLSPAEFFDLLSPIRLAAIFGWLKGATVKDIEMLALKAEDDEGEDEAAGNERSPEEFDRIDGERANMSNKFFKKVTITYGRD